MSALYELFCTACLCFISAAYHGYGSFLLINLLSLSYFSVGLYLFSIGLHCLKLQKILGYLPHAELKAMLAVVRPGKRPTRITTAELEAKDEAAQRLESLPDDQRRFIEKCLVHYTCLTNPKTRQGMRFGIAAVCCFIMLELLHRGRGVFLLLGILCGLAALMRGVAGIVEDI